MTKDEALHLAEQEKQEPVAWMEDSIEFYVSEKPSSTYTIPLYAAPVSAEAEWIETNKALAKEIIEQRNQYLDKLAEAVDLSVKAEREACAKVCDKELEEWGYDADVFDVSIAIRARSEK